jgi:hypothetical protein
MFRDGVAPESRPAGFFTRDTTALPLRYFGMKTAQTMLLVVVTPDGMPVKRYT